MTIDYLRPQFVDTFPPRLESGVLYVSIEFSTCGHLCACGCGEEVITPLSPAQWAIVYDGKDVSLQPSIGNWTLPCKSHYLLAAGHVRWARSLTDREIVLNRARDRRALESDSLHSKDFDSYDLRSRESATANGLQDRDPGGQSMGSRWLRILFRR